MQTPISPSDWFKVPVSRETANTWWDEATNVQKGEILHGAQMFVATYIIDAYNHMIKNPKYNGERISVSVIRGHPMFSLKNLIGTEGRVKWHRTNPQGPHTKEGQSLRNYQIKQFWFAHFIRQKFTEINPNIDYTCDDLSNGRLISQCTMNSTCPAKITNVHLIKQFPNLSVHQVGHWPSRIQGRIAPFAQIKQFAIAKGATLYDVCFTERVKPKKQKKHARQLETVTPPAAMFMAPPAAMMSAPPNRFAAPPVATSSPVPEIMSYVPERSISNSLPQLPLLPEEIKTTQDTSGDLFDHLHQELPGHQGHQGHHGQLSLQGNPLLMTDDELDAALAALEPQTSAPLPVLSTESQITHQIEPLERKLSAITLSPIHIAPKVELGVSSNLCQHAITGRSSPKKQRVQGAKPFHSRNKQIDTIDKPEFDLTAMIAAFNRSTSSDRGLNARQGHQDRQGPKARKGGSKKRKSSPTMDVLDTVDFQWL